MLKRPIVIAVIGYIIGIILGIVGAQGCAPFCTMKNFHILHIVGASIARPSSAVLYMLFLTISILIIINKVIICRERDQSRSNRTNKKIKKYFRILFPKKAIIIFCIFMIMGIVYTFFLNQKYEKTYEFDNIKEVFGIVESIELQDYSNKYIIKVESINGKKYIRTKFILYTKAKAKKLEYGDYIKLSAEYIKPDDSRNYMGFSYRDYLKQNMIYGSIQPTSEIQVIEKGKVNIINRTSNSARNKIIRDVNDNLSHDAGSVFLGILLGEKSQITDEINTYFREGNMAHILAVSGAHVSYVMITLSLLLKKCNKKFYLICTVIILAFFMILTNFTPSVVRACTMAIIALTAKLINKRSDIYNNLGISALIILLYNPYTILNIGFQLTYLGTLGIVLLGKKLQGYGPKEIHRGRGATVPFYLKKHKIKKFVINSILISLSVQILIAPIIIFNFNMLSYNFLISSIVATPIFAGIMIFGIASFALGPICFPILQILLDYLIFISKFISNLPLSKLVIPTPNLISIISYYIVCIAILFSKSKLVFRIIKDREKITNLLKRLVVVLLVICIIVNLVPILKNKDLRIFFIDVGQGDSSLIITPKNKVILIDGGGSPNENYDVGKSTLVPYLLDRGITKVDYMMISHFDNDHVGGLMYVLKSLKVKNILISKQFKESKEYKEFIELADKKKTRIITVKQGDVIKIEKDINFNILYPTLKLDFDDLNNNSIVAKMTYKSFSILFTGDIEKEAENKILKKYNQTTLKSTVLKIAHHGSKTSTIQEFINIVNPKVTLIGVGKNNNFGHPNVEVLARIKNVGAKIYRTDENGEIMLRVDRNGKMWIDKMLN